MVENNRTASGAWRRTPPVSRQWKIGISGNPKGRPKSIDVKTLVQKVNSKKVMVKTPDGKTRKASQGDVVLERLVHQAIRGDVSAQKAIFKCAKQHLKPTSEDDSDSYLRVEELGESYLRMFKALGYVSLDCKVVEELSLTEVNAAFRKFKKVWNDPERQKQLFEKMYGPPLTDEECH